MSDTPHRSLRDDGWDEANRHKWIHSQHAGYDLGEQAIRQWVRDHWHGFLRARWLEHLEGKCFWIELNRDDFGLLRREFPDDLDSRLLGTVVEMFKAGKENLHIVMWAAENGVPFDAVARILTAIDVNSCRLFNIIAADIVDRAAPVAGSAALARAERILRDGHLPADVLPIPQHVRAEAERELGLRPVPPAEFWKSLLDATLRHHHAGQQLVTLRLPKGVVVLAVGRDEVAAFLAHFGPERRSGTTVENP